MSAQLIATPAPEALILADQQSTTVSRPSPDPASATHLEIAPPGPGRVAKGYTLLEIQFADYLLSGTSEVGFPFLKSSTISARPLALAPSNSPALPLALRPFIHSPVTIITNFPRLHSHPGFFYTGHLQHRTLALPPPLPSLTFPTKRYHSRV